MSNNTESKNFLRRFFNPVLRIICKNSSKRSLVNNQFSSTSELLNNTSNSIIRKEMKYKPNYFYNTVTSSKKQNIIIKDIHKPKNINLLK